MVVSIVNGNGGSTIRDGSVSGAVEGARLRVFLIVIDNIGGNDRIVRRSCWVRRWSN